MASGELPETVTQVSLPRPRPLPEAQHVPVDSSQTGILLPDFGRRVAPSTFPSPARVSPPADRLEEPTAPRNLSVEATDPAGDSFVQSSLSAYASGVEIGQVLRVAAPSHWLLFCCLAAGILIALALAAFGRVEVSSRGRGALWRAEGVQEVGSEIDGRVARVHVTSGVIVQAGQVLISIDTTELQTQLFESEAQLAVALDALSEFEGPARALFDHNVALLEQRARLFEERTRSQRGSMVRARRRADTFERLTQEGFASRHEADDTMQALELERQGEFGIRDQLLSARLELTTLRASRLEEQTLRNRAVREARARRAATQLMLRQAEVHATRSGQLESLLVKPGELVSAGTVLARIVPLGAPTQAVAFLPERDRAFLAVGRPVRIEVDQLPVGEFGSLRGRVLRVSSGLASRDEMATFLGADSVPRGAYLRVDVALDDGGQLRKLGSYLRVGAQLAVRFPLRSRTPLALAFEPLRRWLE